MVQHTDIRKLNHIPEEQRDRFLSILDTLSEAQLRNFSIKLMCLLVEAIEAHWPYLADISEIIKEIPRGNKQELYRDLANNVTCGEEPIDDIIDVIADTFKD